MTGNQDEAGRTGPEGAGWAGERMLWIRDLVDETIMAVQIVGTPQDDAAADRRARAIVNIARAIKAVAALERPIAQVDEQPSEMEMSDSCEYEPERMAAMRDELDSRLSGLRAIIEEKRMDRDAGRAGAGSGVGIDPEAAGASGGAAEGLAHLGDAGRSGSGQDLCGRLLAA
ncbi:MAG: hypothetical protein KKA16_06785 [Alphaproteobacteria bacterium]|nr:hypothetical protein [Alphaproteobacteria bacterium]MBU2377772.1 hypothetical protein [Alphaproteobacteria bacterium]